MLEVIYKNKFYKDVELARKRGKDLQKLKALMKLLIEEKPLARKHDDHPLKGDYKGFRECKIEPDWLLIYTKDKTCIVFARTGTHSDLFE